MIRTTLVSWTIAELNESFSQAYRGTNYLVSRQWDVFRIFSHDVHHGGQLSLLLALQNRYPYELTELGGHLLEPPTAP